MLALKLGLSLMSSNNPGGWSPTDEAGLEAWYQNKKGVSVVPTVSEWLDSSPNGVDMVQATVSEQPGYEASSGALIFVAANKNNLQSSSQISLTGDFTVGLRINPGISTAGTFLADNTTSGELFKYQTSSRITVKIDGSASTSLDLDSGTFGDDYLVITRTSNILKLYQNGVLQTGTTPYLEGTADIDTIGVRATDLNAYTGRIKEIQIYSSSSAALVANINNRLSTL